MTIEKKIWPEAFQAIVDGRKTYEVRLADFQCQPGDVLFLREWNPESGEYSGRSIKKEVTYVKKTKDMKFWTPEDVDRYGLQVIAFH